MKKYISNRLVRHSKENYQNILGTYNFIFQASNAVKNCHCPFVKCIFMAFTLVCHFTFCYVLFEAVNCPQQMLWSCCSHSLFSLIFMQFQSIPNFCNNNWVNQECCSPPSMEMKCSTDFTRLPQDLFPNGAQILCSQIIVDLDCFLLPAATETHFFLFWSFIVNLVGGMVGCIFCFSKEPMMPMNCFARGVTCHISHFMLSPHEFTV